MVDSSRAPATKLDIRLLMEMIGKFYDDAAKWKTEILEANEKWKEEITSHFDVVIENAFFDLRDANHDHIEVLKDAKVDHEKRISCLERDAHVL